MKMKERYELNKKANVFDKCICPSCGTKFIKSHYQQAFCKTKGKTVCKDKYWNTVTPTKRNNTTHISPASQRWLDNPDRITGYTSEGYKIIGGVAYDEFDDSVYDVDPYNDDHPFSSDALGQE